MSIAFEIIFLLIMFFGVCTINETLEEMTAALEKIAEAITESEED